MLSLHTLPRQLAYGPWLWPSVNGWLVVMEHLYSHNCSSSHPLHAFSGPHLTTLDLKMHHHFLGAFTFLLHLCRLRPRVTFESSAPWGLKSLQHIIYDIARSCIHQYIISNPKRIPWRRKYNDTSFLFMLHGLLFQRLRISFSLQPALNRH